MTDHFYAVSLGAKSEADVTVGAATAGTAVELRVTDGTTGITGDKATLLQLIEVIEMYIIKNDAPA